MSVTWQGLDEFKRALAALPEYISDDAKRIVDSTAEKVGDTMRAAYPKGDTGGLARGVKVEKSDQVRAAALGDAAAIVRNSAHQAHLWEFGTEVRQTREGWNRGRVYPATDKGLVTLVGTAITEREEMYRELEDMVRRRGFEVNGHVR